MKTPFVSHFRRMARQKIYGLFCCALAVAGLWCDSARATAYYWDGNGTTAGSGTTPNGTLGVDAFLNTSSTGGSGTFTSTPTSSDTIQFVAQASSTDTTSGTTNFTVGISGTQAVSGFSVTIDGITSSNSDTMTLGAAGEEIDVGSGGITVQRYSAPVRSITAP